jgi:thiamine biosynthesis protein ThiI
MVKEKSRAMTAVLHYAEIGLKGGYRPFFEKKLVENLLAACRLHGVDLEEVRREHGRIMCTFGSDRARIESALQHVFGSSTSPSWTRGKHGRGDSHFRHRVSRARQGGRQIERGAGDAAGRQRFRLSSLELNKRIGAEAQRLGLRINFKTRTRPSTPKSPPRAPTCTRGKSAAGRLPVGASGKVLCLLSGGIDSAVAAWLTMKRGCRVDFLHFHSFRENHEALESKLGAIVEALNRYQFSAASFSCPTTVTRYGPLGACPSRSTWWRSRTSCFASRRWWRDASTAALW